MRTTSKTMTITKLYLSCCCCTSCGGDFCLTLCGINCVMAFDAFMCLTWVSKKRIPPVSCLLYLILASFCFLAVCFALFILPSSSSSSCLSLPPSLSLSLSLSLLSCCPKHTDAWLLCLDVSFNVFGLRFSQRFEETEGEQDIHRDRHWVLTVFFLFSYCLFCWQTLHQQEFRSASIVVFVTGILFFHPLPGEKRRVTLFRSWGFSIPSSTATSSTVIDLMLQSPHRFYLNRSLSSKEEMASLTGCTVKGHTYPRIAIEVSR